MEIEKWDLKISKPYQTNIREWKNDNGITIETSSTVYTPHGIVEVFRCNHDGYALTNFRTVVKGREYAKRFRGKCYSQRHCVTLANRFITNLYEEDL